MRLTNCLRVLRIYDRRWEPWRSDRHLVDFLVLIIVMTVIIGMIDTNGKEFSALNPNQGQR